MHRIVGIDPGSFHLGYAAIVDHGNKLELIGIEVLSPPKKDPFFKRLTWLQKELTQRLENFKPHALAIEDTFFGKNASSAFRLGIVRGVIIGKCLEREVEVHEYAPAKIKLAITGYGRAEKVQVQKMLGLMFNRRLEGSLDASDALAIATCHATNYKLSHYDKFLEGQNNFKV